MFNNVALDVFIGLIAIYLLYSLLASILMEALAKRLDLRARMTQKAIAKLLDDSDFTDGHVLDRTLKTISESRFSNGFKERPFTALFYSHPNIANLGRSNLNRKPSDISAEMFSETFVQLLRGDVFTGEENQLLIIKSNLKLNQASEGKIDLPDWYLNSKKPWINDVATNVSAAGIELAINALTLYQIKQFLYDSHSDVNVFKAKLVSWYNEMMDRACGWYIKQTRIILFLIGLVLAIGFNVNTIAITTKLSKDNTARDKMIEFATKIKDRPAPVSGSTDSSSAASFKAFEGAYNDISTVNQVVGSQFSCDQLTPINFVGWLITAFAISLGAPFWFDLLKKIMSVRQAGSSGNPDTSNKADISKTVAPKDRIG